MVGKLLLHEMINETLNIILRVDIKWFDSFFFFIVVFIKELNLLLIFDLFSGKSSRGTFFVVWDLFAYFYFYGWWTIVSEYFGIFENINLNWIFGRRKHFWGSGEGFPIIFHQKCSMLVTHQSQIPSNSSRKTQIIINSKC